MIGSVHRVTDARRDRKFMHLPITSPKHIISNHMLQGSVCHARPIFNFAAKCALSRDLGSLRSHFFLPFQGWQKNFENIRLPYLHSHSWAHIEWMHRHRLAWFSLLFTNLSHTSILTSACLKYYWKSVAGSIQQWTCQAEKMLNFRSFYKWNHLQQNKLY